MKDLKIDPSGELPTGEKFTGITDFRSLIIERHNPFTHALTEKLLTYDLTHHSMVAEKIALLRVHELAEMEAFRDFLVKMKGTKDGNETLLEKTSIISGCFMGSAAQHMSQNLPIILAGGGFKHAGHVMLDKQNNKPLSNLFVSVLQRTGMKIDTFADSTGTQSGIDFKA